MKDLYSQILSSIDIDRVLRETEALWQRELGQTSRNFHDAACYTETLLAASGLQQVERISFPADGKTDYQDKVMPLAWRATRGTLTIKRSPLPFTDPVVADYTRHPFHLVHGSVSTPPEGMMVRILTEEQLFAGMDARNALIILNHETFDLPKILKTILDLGGIGLITDAISSDRFLTPDTLPWVVPCTEGNNWHVNADDRPFIGFAVSSRTGDRLRAAARRGEVIAHAFSDGQRYCGEVEAVTGVIPGEEPRELWLMAHLYEPMVDDDSTGVIACLEIARVLQQLIATGAMPPPRFTLRLVLAMELYGYAAFAERAGGRLHDRVIGALNLDNPPHGQRGNIWFSPPGAPFFGDYLMEEVRTRCARLTGITWNPKEEGAYHDDMALADPTIGVPTIWTNGRNSFHHQSVEDMSVLVSPRRLQRSIAFTGTWVGSMLTIDQHAPEAHLTASLRHARRYLREEAARLQKRGSTPEAIKTAMQYRAQREAQRLGDFARVADVEHVNPALQALARYAQQMEAQCLALSAPSTGSERQPSVWEQIAETIIPARSTRGLPYDLARVPKEQRRELPDTAIYGAFTRMLANMDGEKNLRELMRQAEWEEKVSFNDWRFRRYLGGIQYLAEHGYLRNRYTLSLGQAEIVAALRQAGLQTGDLVLLHSGLSHFGHIEGGADTVLDAFLEVLGPEGTLLLPTFTLAIMFFMGDGIGRRDCQPFDPVTSKLDVGHIPGQLLKRAGVLRTNHPTHSVAGIGRLAAELLADHRETDPPTGRRSPFGKLASHGGKMVFFGAGLTTTTFFHFLEDAADLPYLGDALCAIREPDGGVRMVLVPKHLPGHRDFYRDPGEESKMYRRLLQDGLIITRTPLGFGEIKVIDSRQMETLGLAALADDPTLFLCDNPECLFCAQAKAACTGAVKA